MQVFLPFPNISLSLKCLDKRRLGKQRVEARQILDTLKKKELNTSLPAWGNHPAVLMFAGYTDFLSLYYNCCLEEFARRGGRNILCKAATINIDIENIAKPFWFGDSCFHDSHKSNLLRKAIDDNNLQNRPELLDILRNYGINEETADPTLEYYWPVLRLRTANK